MRIELTVNTRDVSVEAPPTETLLATLRERLQLTGTKEACVEGECGACTVLVNGRPVDSCIYATAAADGLSITTVEGLGGPDGSLSPLQQSFVDHFAIQCGFCPPGFLVTRSALLVGIGPGKAAQLLLNDMSRDIAGYGRFSPAIISELRAAEKTMDGAAMLRNLVDAYGIGEDLIDDYLP